MISSGLFVKLPMAERASIAILILTKNEEINLPVALASVSNWAQEVFVLDSGSTDRTEQITKEYGAAFVYHAWEGYARQKNWGLDNLPITAKWVFILDADEAITPELRDELIEIAAQDSCPEDAFYVNRYLLFMGKRIRHCGYYPSWNLRFFRRGKARYEEREVHEHMICPGAIGYLKGHMEHVDRRGLDHFIAKHNHYSTLEAREIFRIQKAMTGGTMKFRFWAGPIERRRWIKHKVWPKVPFRSLVRFIYMYLLRFGFLDGQAGFHLCVILAGYEHQITVKLDELWKQSKKLNGTAVNGLPPTPPPPQPASALPPPQYPAQAIKLNGGTKGKSMESFRDRFGADTTDGERWPYPKRIYVMRLIWAIVWRTLWKVCWWRISILRTTILRLFGAKVGSVGMSGSTWIEMPWDLQIGHNCIVGPRASLYNLGGLSIGDHTVISQDAYICGGTHDYTDPTYPLIRMKTTIGSYVWIAAGAFIHPGVTIGDGAVIGARAVVTKDVPPWTVVSGHPAKVIKQRVMRTTRGLIEDAKEAAEAAAAHVQEAHLD